MAYESASGQDEAKAEFWLATRGGKPWTHLFSEEELLPKNIAKTANIQLNKL